MATTRTRKKPTNGLYQMNIKVDKELIESFDSVIAEMKGFSRSDLIRGFMSKFVVNQVTVKRDCQFYSEGYCLYKDLRVQCPVLLGRDWDCLVIPKHGEEIHYGIELKDFKAKGKASGCV